MVFLDKGYTILQVKNQNEHLFFSNEGQAICETALRIEESRTQEMRLKIFTQWDFKTHKSALCLVNQNLVAL